MWLGKLIRQSRLASIRSNTPPQESRDYWIMSDCTSLRRNCSMKRACFWAGTSFVNPSATISCVGTQVIFISLFCTSWRSQDCMISMCLSLVSSFGVSFCSRRIVYRLSHLIEGWWAKESSIWLNSLIHHRNSFAVTVNAPSSDSVLEVVTCFCFVAFQWIGPPYNWKKNPIEECRVSLWSANAASL